MKILAPSILSADFNRLGEEMKATERAGAKYLHFDVMDGMFVPNISFGIPVLQSVSQTTNQVMDVHLMVHDPIRYVEQFAQAGADIITVHYEACENLEATFEKIKECGAKIGLSINPETPSEAVYPYINQIDLILVMGVHPGFGGQKLIPETFQKIKDIHEAIVKSGKIVDLEVDGGIKADNVESVMEAGANVIVMGSAVFGQYTEENTRKIMEIMNRET